MLGSATSNGWPSHCLRSDISSSSTSFNHRLIFPSSSKRSRFTFHHSQPSTTKFPETIKHSHYYQKHAYWHIPSIFSSFPAFNSLMFILLTSFFTSSVCAPFSVCCAACTSSSFILRGANLPEQHIQAEI